MANFYNRFLDLCVAAGKKPSPTAKEIGITSAAVARWKKGGMPSPATQKLIANYFGITLAELIGDPLDTLPSAAERAAMTQSERDASDAAHYEALGRATYELFQQQVNGVFDGNKKSPADQGEADRQALIDFVSNCDDKKVLWAIVDAVNAKLRELTE